MMKEEIWKDIKGYESFYQISNYGRVKAVGNYRSIYTKEKTRKSVYFSCDKILTPFDNGNGYLVVSFKKLGQRKNFYIHRLVAEHFLEKPFDKRYVNHIDYDTKNNHVNNLEWTTQKENIKHSAHRMKKPKKIYRKSNTGEKYISKKRGVYCVNIRQANKHRTFQTLEKALAFRNEVLNEIGFTI